MISGPWSSVSSSPMRRLLFLGILWSGLACSVVPIVMAGAASTAAQGDSISERIRALRTELARHDELYFKKATPEITDAEYDRLKQQLTDLEDENPGAVRNIVASPAPALGDDRSGLFPTYHHRERMLSLAKSYSEADVRAFDARLSYSLGKGDLEYMVEPKFDGLAVSVTYEKGRLVRAVTRGDGVEGDDVTANVLTIEMLPRELAGKSQDGFVNLLPDLIELRGEVYLSYAEFGRINREREEMGEPPYAHPRNLAAGTLKQLDPREVGERRLEMVFYGWGGWEPADTQPASQAALVDQLLAWGLPTIEAPRLVRGAEAMWQAVQAVGHERKGLPFPIDGAVVKLNTTTERQKVGATEQWPNWAIAYKFRPDQAVTEVRGITIQVGRTGVLTPVAELVPVQLGGSTIARATLHNRDEIQRRDIRIGDFVHVERAGEIIPVITQVVLARRPVSATKYPFPDTCPACRTPVLSEAGEAAVRCHNGNCPAQVRRRIEYFASKAGADISGLGPATIDALVDQGYVKSVADLYRLKRTELLAISGVGEITADNLLAEIQRSRTAEMWRMINGLGIPRVGPITAMILASRYSSLPALARCSRVELLATSEKERGRLGPAVVEAVLAFFSRAENQELVAALVERGVRPTAAKPARSAGNRVAGKVFVLTGALAGLTRAEANARIVAAGGQIAESVTRKTNYVVAGRDAGIKLSTARRMGITIIDEAELLLMLGAE